MRSGISVVGIVWALAILAVIGDWEIWALAGYWTVMLIGLAYLALRER